MSSRDGERVLPMAAETAQACNDAISRFRSGQLTKPAALASITASLEVAGDSSPLKDYAEILDADEVATEGARDQGGWPRGQSIAD